MIIEIHYDDKTVHTFDAVPKFRSEDRALTMTLSSGTTRFFLNVALENITPSRMIELSAIEPVSSGTGEAPKQVKIFIS